jgi:hypothetical protein
MATIKTQLISGQPRIITKLVNGQRRVSCSCCEEAECCMYPAQALGDGIYTWEDLPDQIIYRGRLAFNNAVIDVTFNKLSPPAEWYDTLAYYIAEDSPAINSGDEDVIYRNTEDNWANWISGGISGIGICLIEGLEVVGGTEDTFLDTYAITSSDPDPFFQGCDSITRVNLCTWLHPLEGCDLTTTLRGRIFYHDGTTTIYEQEAPHGWYYDFGQENFVRKNDPQNSPEGIYDLGFVSYTVS